MRREHACFAQTVCYLRLMETHLRKVGISSMIAKPGMRERPYRMFLDEDGELTENFSGVEGKATLMLLDRLEVVRIVYLDSVAELRKTIESLRASP
jgi:hypothetical protein